MLAGAAGSLTFGKLRAAAHRLVLELDPESAQRRKEAAKQDAHVRRFREDSGNAGMVARELSPDEVLASWQHVEQRALDLRAAGMPGTLQELRVRAYLDLLQERDSRRVPADPDGTGEPAGPQDDGSGPGGGGGPGGHGGPSHGPAGSPGGGGRAREPGRDTGPSFAALVNITVPWSALPGPSGAPADVAGFGLADAADARDLAAAAARDPRTRWCVTVLRPDGTAAAHGCAAGRHPPPGIGDPATTPGPGPPPGTGPQDWIGRLHITMAPIARGTCGHDHAESGYRPSRTLQHLVKVRNARCTAPGCGRPAARCDLDHTIAWQQGGPTCECDLAPLCRA
ncbi:MAG TPA: HNH endonuclease signature motif containing protein [Streptosporangiaceae bacterium]